MKQVIRAGLPRDECRAFARMQRKVGTVPVVALAVVEVEIMYFLHEGWLDTGMLHQELVKESSATLLRSDNEKIRQHPHRSGG